jgi:hypothetical protein
MSGMFAIARVTPAPGGRYYSGPGGRAHNGPGGPDYAGPGGRKYSGPAGGSIVALAACDGSGGPAPAGQLTQVPVAHATRVLVRPATLGLEGRQIAPESANEAQLAGQRAALIGLRMRLSALRLPSSGRPFRESFGRSSDAHPSRGGICLSLLPAARGGMMEAPPRRNEIFLVAGLDAATHAQWQSTVARRTDKAAAQEK